MTNQRSFIAIAITMLLLSRAGAATAQEGPAIEPAVAPARAERNHSVSLGLGALAGASSLTYEYRWSRDRGLVLELHALYLPTDENGRTGVGGAIGLALQLSGVRERGNFASTGLGAAIGHRWHWRRGSREGFYGLHAGADIAQSHDYSEATVVEHWLLYLLGNIGQQWRIRDDFLFTVRIGAGLALRSKVNDYEKRFTYAVRPVDQLVEGIPITLDAELSVGYTF